MPEAKREQTQKDLLRGVLTAESIAQRGITKRVRDVAQYAANTGLTPGQAGFLLQRQVVDAITEARARSAASSATAFERQTGLAANEEEEDATHRAASLPAAHGIEKAFRSAVAKKMSDGVGARLAFAGAARAMKPAIERTATTEVMSAWNGEARRQSARANVVITHTWNAELDACEECSGLAGKTVTGDEQFAEGDPPLHPRCHCVIESSVVASPVEELIEALRSPALAH